MPLRLTLLFAIGLSLLGCSRRSYPLSEGYVNPLEHYRYGCERIDSLEVRAALPRLEREYGASLTCPAVYRGKVLAALSFYPELKGLDIRIVRKPLKTSMAARPGNFSPTRNGRFYKIYVDDVTVKPTDFRRYPYSAQIGCFLHELGHVAYYEQRSNLRLMYDGLRYVGGQGYRTRYEKYADRNMIERGGGYYGYLFRDWTLNHAGISKAYRRFKRENYTTARALLELHLEVAARHGARCGSISASRPERAALPGTQVQGL